MKERMTILMVGPQSPAIGGIASYIEDLNKSLEEQHNLTVISIKPYVVTDISLKNLVIKIFTIFTNSVKILKTSFFDKFTLAHVHTSSNLSLLENSIYTLLLKFCCRKKVILHIHAPDFDKYFRRDHKDFTSSQASIFQQYAIKRILNLCDSIIVLSNYWEKLIISEIHDPSKIVVVPNAVNETFFLTISTADSRNKLGLPQDKKIIFSLGVLVPRKGFHDLITAMKIVTQTRQDVLCVIGGKGGERDKLLKMISDKNLQDSVLLAGYIPSSSLNVWYNAIDLFVLPSYSEGLPIAMLEALACGKPFVGTRVGGVPEIITSDDYGLLVDPADTEDLAEKILIALDREWDQEAILAYAEQYTWENITKEIMGVYEQVLR